MAKKHSKHEKEHELSTEEDTQTICADCGQSDCCCGQGCECGDGQCGSGACDPSGCESGCGSSCGGGAHGCGVGHGGWHSGSHKIFAGIGLIALSVLWYAKNTGMIADVYFWPLVFGLAGVGILVKGVWMKHREQSRGCC